jgi:hypothetical protein
MRFGLSERRPMIEPSLRGLVLNSTEWTLSERGRPDFSKVSVISFDVNMLKTWLIGSLLRCGDSKRGGNCVLY